jgi:hypothetical protein
MTTTTDFERELVDGGWNVTSMGVRNAIRAAFAGLKFRTEISAAEPARVRVIFAADLDPAQETLLASTYADNKAKTDPQAVLRDRLLKSVDGNTKALIAQGFEYPADSGQIFSSSVAAQANWTTLTALAAAKAMQFPTEMPFIDDSGQLAINNAEELGAWGMTGAGRVLGIRSAGSVLKKQLRAMATRTQLQAFKDPRV